LACQITNVKGIVAAASVPATSLWPYKFVTSLLARVVEMGALLYTETPVTDVSQDNTNEGPGSSAVLLSTPRGTTRAGAVLHATNAYAAATLPQYRGVIVPVRGQNSILVPLGRSHHGLNLAHTYNLHYSAAAVDYLVPRPDGTIILGGATGVYRRGDADRNAKWFDTVDDATLIDEGVKAHFDSTMAKHFRGWERSEASAAMTWTGSKFNLYLLCTYTMLLGTIWLTVIFLQ
jgi:glycine/D-amino acid oxidase-like deaminating enzyme